MCQPTTFISSGSERQLHKICNSSLDIRNKKNTSNMKCFVCTTFFKINFHFTLLQQINEKTL